MNPDKCRYRADRAPTTPGAGVGGTAPVPVGGAVHRSPARAKNATRPGAVPQRLKEAP